ncbi:MAG TPA: DUF3810 domain-containing protein [Mobilitalea sp.]|nr:DUF3810 domain-containing protein [Mobilitalea sp.]
MKSVLKLKRIYLLILFPVSLVLIILAKNSSYFAEQIFALHIYKWFSQAISMITGLIPISLAELLIFALPLLLLLFIILFITHILREKDRRLSVIIKGLLNALCIGSVVFFLFTVLAGINYYRYSFSHYSKLEIKESVVDELYALTDSLSTQANALREMLPETDEDGVFKLSESKYKLARIADRAMDTLSEEYTILSGHYSAPKPVLMSSLMSYLEITGIFMPFTMEANVNVDVPDYSIPATMLHELAHLRGFMREDEANYIAYLAGMSSGNTELQYSSTMLALVISGNELYNQDIDLYRKIKYSDGVLRDLRANSRYWAKYEDTVVSTISNKVNDTYLKANAQVDGVKSYGRMLDLLLAKYRKDHEE